MPNQNDRPPNYRGPSTKLGEYLVKEMLRSVLPNPLIQIVGSNEEVAVKNGELGFVLHPPTLVQTIYMLMFPDYWVGTHYAKGNWYLSKGDLADFMQQLMLQAPSGYMSYLKRISKFRGPYFQLRRYLLDPLESRQVSTHYDLEAELYESFLDAEMIYTCAFFENENSTLEEAQERKKELVARRLKVENTGDYRILNVGSGWGGFERYLTRKFANVSVTGITLASNQIRWSEAKNQNALTPEQLQRVHYENAHYLRFKPDQDELYDGIIAIGMIEHVGLKNYGEFVGKSKRLLKKGGRCLVHTIVSPEGAVPSNKWIEAFIFPGGYTPALSELVNAFETEGLVIEEVHLHEGQNYFQTLDIWRKRFLQNWMSKASDDQKLAFGRMWHFYLSVSRNMFDPNLLRHQVAHVLIKKL